MLAFLLGFSLLCLQGCVKTYTTYAVEAEHKSDKCKMFFDLRYTWSYKMPNGTLFVTRDCGNGAPVKVGGEFKLHHFYRHYNYGDTKIAGQLVKPVVWDGKTVDLKFNFHLHTFYWGIDSGNLTAAYRSTRPIEIGYVRRPE